MPSPRKQHLVETALKLFYQEGFHSTGIDKVLAESGVAKMTLYKHFPSKNDLIRAVLEERDRQFREWFFQRVDAQADSSQEKLTAVFDVLGEWIQGADFRGCMFINAAAEFSSKDEAISEVVAQHKRLMRDYILELAKEADLEEPEILADQLSLLLEGAIVLGHTCGQKSAAAKAKTAAIKLLEAAVQPGRFSTDSR